MNRLATAGLALALPFAAAAGCNAIIGADAPKEKLVSSEAASCVLNSDCDSAKGEVCIFRVCSSPCRADGDCAEGSRCLKTESGTACVANVSATCPASDPCPDGTACLSGICRNQCSDGQGCLGDQTCTGGACVGTSASHDPGVEMAAPDAAEEEPAPDAGQPLEAGPPPDAGPDAGPDATVDAGPPCALGTRECNGQQPQICMATGWVDDGLPCTYVCGASGCEGVCMPGKQQCAPDGLGTETCATDGGWGSEQACPYVCTGGACGGSCAPGAKGCNGSTPQTCGSDGTWDAGAPCPNVCSSGTCTGSCTPTTKQCSNLIPETCNSGGTWDAGTACPYLCTGGSCTGNCSPGDTKCFSGTTYETCSAAGAWSSPIGCTYICSGKTCGGSCTPSDTKCINDTQKETCSSTAQWGDAGTCPYACVGKTCGGSCVPGGVQCSVNDLQSCDTTGTWQTTMACGGGTPLCRSNTCVASNPYDVGNSTELGDIDTESPNFLTVMEITVSYRTSLLKFGVYGQEAGGNVEMVIYGESATTPGTPGPLVMSSIPVAIAAGQVESPPAQATNLAPGHYWIGGVYSATANTRWSMAGGPQALYFNDTYPNTPNTFPTTGVTSFTGYTYNYFIVVQDY